MSHGRTLQTHEEVRGNEDERMKRAHEEIECMAEREPRQQTHSMIRGIEDE
jgi:hypothetical protein